MATARKTKSQPKRPADPWMTLGEAARELHTSRQTILTRAVKGEIEAQHVAGRTLVSRASVERCRANDAA